MLSTKKTAPLLAGIGLPVIAAVLFILASILPRHFVAPPGYDFLYSVECYGVQPDVDLRYRVENGKLKAEYRKHNPRNLDVEPRMFRHRLFRFDAATLTSREIPMTAPGHTWDDATDDELWHELPVRDSEEMTLDDHSATAPDGYRFRRTPEHSFSLLTRILFHHRVSASQRISIDKAGRIIPVPVDAGDGYFGYNVHFLGWIIARAGTP